MHLAPKGDHYQAIPWNGDAGRGWVEAQDLLDRLFQPFAGLLMAPVRAGSRGLDIGCGTGSTTVAMARLAGNGGRAVGIDISEVMIDAARARADRERTPASFIRADAETYCFEPGIFDVILSRFGVMFFADPVRAFQNLRRAASDVGELRFLAWRSAGENPFMTAAERSAAPLLPDLPVRRDDEPGQFAFADARKVRAILEESGWADIEIAPTDVPCALPERELVDYLTCIGPVGRMLRQTDERTRAQVIQAVLPAFDPYVSAEEVRFSAACWLVTAKPDTGFKTGS